MKKGQFIILLTTLFVLLSITISCKDDKDSILEGNGLKEQSWSNGKTYSISTGQTLQFTFNAQSSWTSDNSSPALLVVSPDAGTAGKSTLKVTANNSSSQQQGTITIKVNGYPAVSRINFKLNSSTIHKDEEINSAVDKYLKERYLWNDEYNTLSPDFSLAYDKFLENTLMSMSTNTLDKKRYTDGNGRSYYELFSFIQKIDPDLQSTRNAIEKKTKEYNFGFVDMLPVRYEKSPHSGIHNVLLAVQGIHPESSAAQAGIKRGTEITHVNGRILTESNWLNYYYSLRLPDSPTSLEITDGKGKTYQINSGPIYPNPIIHSQVTSIDSHQIGYLAYSAFEAGFDKELFDIFINFHNQQITDLILDLRYNGGGHVISANLMASCIAGEASRGKIFAAYRYNKSRMEEEFGGERPTELFAYEQYANLNNISLAAGALNLRTVYCLVSDDTASASELVINSLKGIGINVRLIGMTTHGKNVGMEGTEISTAAAKYLLYPITFQTYNALEFGDYENGFQPTYKIDENNPNGLSFEGYGDFGTEQDPLYAQAISLITGKRSVKSITRSVNQTIGKSLAKPEVKRIGMIK